MKIISEGEFKIVSSNNKDSLDYFVYFTEGKKITSEELTSFEGLITIFSSLA
jgi:hypothetical protein